MNAQEARVFAVLDVLVLVGTTVPPPIRGQIRMDASLTGRRDLVADLPEYFEFVRVHRIDLSFCEGLSHAHHLGEPSDGCNTISLDRVSC